MLGKIKPYYCKAEYIWLDENGDITSHSREEYKKDKKNLKNQRRGADYEYGGN